MEIDFQFSLKLLAAGPDRLRTIAAIRTIRPDLAPAAAKALLDAAPVILRTNIARNEIETVRTPFTWIAEVEVIDTTFEPLPGTVRV